MENSRNADVLRRMISYCDEISKTIQRFGNDFETFAKDSVYKNATALCLLQIGELTTLLTDEFKQTYTKIPWAQIKALRNVVLHNYGKIDAESLWETITYDIPAFREYCSNLME